MQAMGISETITTPCLSSVNQMNGHTIGPKYSPVLSSSQRIGKSAGDHDANVNI
jgi:hypothetical protein